AACKEKPSDTTPETGSEGTPATAPAVETPKAEPLKATATAAKRAEKLGFAKNLPKEISHYEAMFNGRKAFDKLMATDLGQFIIERMEAEGMEYKDMLENEQVAAQIATYSEEYFAAYGEGTDESFQLAYDFMERAAYFGAKVGVFAADGYMREGEDFNIEGPKVLFEGPLKGAPKELIKMMARFDMPAFYQGARVSDEETRELVSAQMEELASQIGNGMPDATEEVIVKRGGSEFKGYKIVGAKLAEMIGEEETEELKKGFDIEDIEAFKKELAKKNIVIVSGSIGEYVISFIGKSIDDLKFVDDVEQSICANEKMVFMDKYLDKELLYAGYSDADFVNKVGNVESVLFKILGSAASGASDGLGDATSLGDTQDIEALLEDIKSQGDKIAGFVGYMEDGLKVEVYGGSNLPALDLNSSHTLSSLETSNDTLLFANWTNNEDYNTKILNYIDSLGETSYLVAKRLASQDADGDREIEEFQEGLNKFDSKLRENVLGLWKTLRGEFAEGLGSESAVVVDINGSFPKVPNVPPVVLKEGKVPRVAIASRVADRDKLKQSWEKINTNLEKLLATIGEMQGGEPIPMQSRMSSDKDGLKTWFIAFPFLSDDFVPSVSVSDELFFASTSKTFSEGLAEKFKAGGGVARKGAWLRVDFKVLSKFAKEWRELIEKNADELERITGLPVLGL
ncbi:MAG: hypothetical protein ACPGUY_06310, partial [Akkermansiaceae bacterium]